MAKQDVQWNSRFWSGNFSSWENDGFYLVNPLLDLKPALSADEIAFFCISGHINVEQDPQTIEFMINIIISCNVKCLFAIGQMGNHVMHRNYLFNKRPMGLDTLLIWLPVIKGPVIMQLWGKQEAATSKHLLKSKMPAM